MTKPTTSTTLPVAVAHPVADLLIGPTRAATVLTAHPAAVILCVEPAPDEAHSRHRRSVTRVISLLTRDASGVPNGVRTTLSAADRPFAGIGPHDVAFVGGGGLRVAGLAGSVVRTIRTGVPHIVAAPHAIDVIAGAAEHAARGVDDEPVDDLRTALDLGDPIAVRHAVRALVGLGGGSTPGGDDVLAGAIAGLLATRRDVLAQQLSAAALPDLDSRTTLLSADLLRLASKGHVCTEAGTVLRAVHACRDTQATAELDRALTALLAVGHTSGADLATGLAIGLAAASQPLPRRPRWSRRSSTAAGTA